MESCSVPNQFRIFAKISQSSTYLVEILYNSKTKSMELLKNTVQTDPKQTGSFQIVKTNELQNNVILISIVKQLLTSSTYRKYFEKPTKIMKIYQNEPFYKFEYENEDYE